jgi:hypothetical protein
MLRKLNDEGQSSRQSNKQEQLWLVKVSTKNPMVIENPEILSTNDITSKDQAFSKHAEDVPPQKISVSPEIFLTDDNIIHT